MNAKQMKETTGGYIQVLIGAILCDIILDARASKRALEEGFASTNRYSGTF